VGFYASITDSDIGGRGIRWQETESAASLPQSATGAGSDSTDTQRDSASGEALPGTGASLALGTYRDLWAGPITELNPPLKFLKPSQRLEVSPEDAARLSLSHDDKVRVTQGAKSLEATVAIRERVPEGVCFLAEGVAGANANGLLNGHQVRVEIEKLSEVPA
jgi:anaerobic selenocysteine-containing dehydrogenase